MEVRLSGIEEGKDGSGWGDKHMDKGDVTPEKLLHLQHPVSEAFAPARATWLLTNKGLRPIST